jgi:hypothetical protein
VFIQIFDIVATKRKRGIKRMSRRGINGFGTGPALMRLFLAGKQ